MANLVDGLFDQVLSQLAPLDPDDDVLPEGLEDPVHDALDRPPRDIGEGDLTPIEGMAVRDGVLDRMTGRLTLPEPSEEAKDLVAGGIRQRGFEAIAFYKSRRFIANAPYPGKWGIFYLNDALHVVAWQIQQEYPSFRDPRALAREFLRAHEHFHFQADLQTLMFEAVKGQHLYVPARRRFRGRRADFVEEALANRHAYQWASKGANGIREFAHDFMMLQPGAYSRFLEPSRTLSAEWASSVVDGTGPIASSRNDIAPWVTAVPSDFLRRSLCPEYVIFPTRLSDWIDPACVAPPVRAIEEDDKLLKRLGGKLRHLHKPWEDTKRKLKEDKDRPGLNFKPWPKEGKGAWSVKVDDGNRAHLRNRGDGNWLAYAIGGHKEMGHG